MNTNKEHAEDYIPCKAPSNKAHCRRKAGMHRQAISAQLQDLMELVSSLLGSGISKDEPLMEAGLDSLGAVELRNSVSAKFGVELPATVTFDHPSVVALAEYVAAKVAPQQTVVLHPQTMTVADLGAPARQASPEILYIQRKASANIDEFLKMYFHVRVHRLHIAS